MWHSKCKQETPGQHLRTHKHIHMGHLMTSQGTGRWQLAARVGHVDLKVNRTRTSPDFRVESSHSLETLVRLAPFWSGHILMLSSRPATSEVKRGRLV